MRSLIGRYDQAAAAAQLDQVGDALGATLTEPTEVQRRFLELVTGLAARAEKSLSTDTPAILVSAMAMLRRSGPMLLEGITRAPDERIIGFLTVLRDDVQHVLNGGPAAIEPAAPVVAAAAAGGDTVTHDEHSDAGAADQPGADQPAGHS